MATAEEVLTEAGLGPDEFHSRSDIKQVPVDSLRIDRTYQRDLSDRVVDEIAEAWNEVAAELILVSDRGEDGLFVINGQHRTMAAKKLGHKKIWARVVRMDDLADPGMVEADLRLKTNSKLVDRPPERFKAQLRAGNPESLAIQKILKKFKTEINFVPSKDHGLNSVSTIEDLYRIDDTGGVLTEALQAIHDAFGKVDSATANASMLKAVAWFLHRHTMEANPDRLVESLRAVGPAGLMMRASMRRGSEGGSVWVNLYNVLLDLYNEGLMKKHRLIFSLRGISRSSTIDSNN